MVGCRNGLDSRWHRQCAAAGRDESGLRSRPPSTIGPCRHVSPLSRNVHLAREFGNDLATGERTVRQSAPLGDPRTYELGRARTNGSGLEARKVLTVGAFLLSGPRMSLRQPQAHGLTDSHSHISSCAGSTTQPAAPMTQEGTIMHQLLTVEQAAERFGTSPRFVRRLIAERRIAFTKLGRHVRLSSADVEAFILAGQVPPRHGVRPDEPRDARDGRRRRRRNAASPLAEVAPSPGRCPDVREAVPLGENNWFDGESGGSRPAPVLQGSATASGARSRRR